MKLLLLLLALAVAAIAQPPQVINPSDPIYPTGLNKINANFTSLYNGKAGRWSGSGPPTMALPYSVGGDFYRDTLNHLLYWCDMLIGPCTAVAAGNWTLVGSGGGGGGNILSLNGDSTAAQTLTRSNDANVTMTIVDNGIGNHNYVMGWTGTLAAGRLNSNVVQSVVNDTNVTGSITLQVLTLGWTGALSKARQFANTVYNDQANAYGAFLQDFSGASLKVPVFSGATTTTNGLIAYDSTGNILHAAQAGADAKIPQYTVNPVDGDPTCWSVGATVKLTNSGCPGSATLPVKFWDSTRISGTQLTFGSGCAAATPCNIRGAGDTIYSFVTSTVPIISAGSSTLYFYELTGTLYCGHNGLTFVSNSGCTLAGSTTAFPANSLPLYTWVATSGVWGATGTNYQAPLTNPRVTGSNGVGCTSANTCSADSTVSRNFSGSAPPTGAVPDSRTGANFQDTSTGTQFRSVNPSSDTTGINSTNWIAIPGHFTLPKTATYQVVADDFYQCREIPVASGTFTITLVASGTQPADGQCITVVNYGSGVVTIARSGQNINGGTSSLTLTAGSATAPTSAFIWSNGTDYFGSLAGAPSGGASGWSLISNANSSADIAVGNTDTDLVSVSIPSIAAGKCMGWDVHISFSSIVDLTQLKVKFGSTVSISLTDTVVTSDRKVSGWICNNAAVQNAQTASASDQMNNAGYQFGTNVYDTGTETTSGAVTFKVTAVVATSTENAQVRSYMIYAIN